MVGADVERIRRRAHACALRHRLCLFPASEQIAWCAASRGHSSRGGPRGEHARGRRRRRHSRRRVSDRCDRARRRHDGAGDDSDRGDEARFCARDRLGATCVRHDAGRRRHTADAADRRGARHRCRRHADRQAS
jgi:hypothetical protein